MNKSLRIGTLVGGQDAVRVIPQIMQHGFESFNLTFWQTTGDLDLAETAKRVREIVDEQGIVISAVSVFGNPLTGAGDNADTLASWERVIDHAQLFGADIVSGFTGRLTDQPINESIPGSRKYLVNWHAGQQTGVYGLLLKTVIWEEPGRQATGTLPITQRPGR